MTGAMGSHHKTIGNTDVWLTPPIITNTLGPFDLDPCAATDRPWDTAAKHYTEADDGLAQPWDGLVWMNPPYSRFIIGTWLGRLADHGSGIALIFARTETAVWHKYIWERADSVLFVRGRLHFHRPDGTLAPGNAGAPSALIGYGATATERLRAASTTIIPGALVTGWHTERNPK